MSLESSSFSCLCSFFAATVSRCALSLQSGQRGPYLRCSFSTLLTSFSLSLCTGLTEAGVQASLPLAICIGLRLARVFGRYRKHTTQSLYCFGIHGSSRINTWSRSALVRGFLTTAGGLDAALKLAVAFADFLVRVNCCALVPLSSSKTAACDLQVSASMSRSAGYTRYDQIMR